MFSTVKKKKRIALRAARRTSSLMNECINIASRTKQKKLKRFFLFFCSGAMILGLAGLGVSGQGGRLNAALSLWLDASSSDKRPSAGGGGRNTSGGLQES